MYQFKYLYEKYILTYIPSKLCKIYVYNKPYEKNENRKKEKGNEKRNRKEI